MVESVVPGVPHFPEKQLLDQILTMGCQKF